MKRPIFKKSCLILLILAVLSACTSAAEKAEDARLATEVALISASLRGTTEAGWTPTPLPTETPIPTAAPAALPASEAVVSEPENSAALPVQPDPGSGSGSDSWFDEPDLSEFWGSSSDSSEAIPTDTAQPTNTPEPTATPYIEPFATRTPGPGAPTPDRRLPAEDWRDWPVVPEISDNAADIYWYGVQKRGTNPKYLSRVGDCHSEADVFMGMYDTGAYTLEGEDRVLQSAVNYFQGSFYRISYSVHAGISTSSVLTSMWSDPSVCNLYESALDCEIRINNPSIMFVNLGSNWIQGVSMDVYYGYLTEIVEHLIERGILPILSSKADNTEGDWGINETTARVAREYDIPFYNFWAIAQILPYGGIDPGRDGIHLAPSAWNVRSLYALKTLYAVGQKLGLF